MRVDLWLGTASNVADVTVHSCLGCRGRVQTDCGAVSQPCVIGTAPQVTPRSSFVVWCRWMGLLPERFSIYWVKGGMWSVCLHLWDGFLKSYDGNMTSCSAGDLRFDSI